MKTATKIVARAAVACCILDGRVIFFLLLLGEIPLLYEKRIGIRKYVHSIQSMIAYSIDGFTEY